MKPIKRESLDKAVTAMFRQADGDHDGLVTIAEVRAVVEKRRDEIIRTRFAAIDSDRNGSISQAEFFAWQKQMGSVASSERRALGDDNAPIAEAIMPQLGDDAEDRILSRLIEPLNATTIALANSNYDAGASLDEVLAYERKRFDAADADHDGLLSEEEIRSLDPRDKRPGGGPGPGGPASGRGGPPPCPPDRAC